MKKLMTILLVCVCVLVCVGCNKQPQQVQGNQLLREGNVINIDVTSLPELYNYSFDGKDAKAIVDYLSSLSLESDYEENPDVYAGMTWVITLEYKDGEALSVYHFGNTFIRCEDGPWYKMTYEEANRFNTLLDELNN